MIPEFTKPIPELSGGTLQDNVLVELFHENLGGILLSLVMQAICPAPEASVKFGSYRDPLWLV